MLLSLSVQDFVIVEALSLEFTNGFTVLTGETGAGKSIILHAVGLLLGDRADGTLVREGQERADISALFQINHRPELVDWLDTHALAAEDDTVLVRRVLDRHGRSRSFINGSTATLTQLKTLGDFLIDIHGQHAHQSLLRSDTQRALLDAYANSDALANGVQQAWQQWQKAKKVRETAQTRAHESALDRERLSWQVNELTELDLQPDEWGLLNQAHSRLANAAELLQQTQYAIDSLADREGNCLSLLTTVQSRLSRLSAIDPRLTPFLSRLDSINTELRDVVYSLRDYANGIDEQPSELATLEHRLDILLSAARKYRIQPPQLLTVLADGKSQLAELESSIDTDSLAKIEADCLAYYHSLAEPLSKQRRQAAFELSQRISKEMHYLAMAGARFSIELTPLAEPGTHGLESIEYRVAINAGTSPQSLAKVASGGELSRISLALQVAISQVAKVPTLIFDEVDVGIGGRVAEVVGKLLRQLGNRYQVLCITHLPQVASCGQQHWHVSKTDQKGQMLSRIDVLKPEERIIEIARMLGGTTITATTRQHAAEMLALNAVNK